MDAWEEDQKDEVYFSSYHTKERVCTFNVTDHCWCWFGHLTEIVKQDNFPECFADGNWGVGAGSST